MTRNGCSTNRRSASEQESLGLEDCVDFGQYDLGQAKLLEKMPKPQYCRFVWKAGGTGIQASKPTIDRHVVQSLFHRWIGIIIPKLQEMNPQHRFNGKRRSARLRHWGITLNNPNERGPRHNGIHLFEKDPLAGLLGCDFEAAIGEGSLFHASILSSHGLERPGFAEFSKAVYQLTFNNIFQEFANMNSISLKPESITHLHLASCINSLLINDRRLYLKKCILILDAGCGNGKLISYLTSILGHLQPNKDFVIHGFDIVDHGVQRDGFIGETVGMLSILHPHIDWSKRIHALSADDSWNFNTEDFDFILSNQVLEHVADKQSFFRNINAKLVAGGYSVHLAPLKHCIQEGHIFIPFAHRFRSFAGLCGYISFMSRLGFGNFPRQSGPNGVTLKDWSERHADYIYFWTNYATESETLDYCRKNRLRADFRFSLEFYTSKLREIFKLGPKYVYRYRDRGFFDLFIIKLLRYISSVTLVCKKDNTY